MKKVLAIFAAAAVLFALFAAPVYADRTPRFFLEGPSSVNVGDTFDVQLKIEGDFKASIMSVRVGFDPASLRYVSSETGPASFGIANDGLTVEGNEYSYGAMLMMGTSSTEGVISTIKFEVLSTATTSIRLDVIVKEFELFDIVTSTQAEPIAHTADNLTITVNGGSGTGPTQIPGPGSATEVPGTTPNPIGPVGTPDPAGNTEAPRDTKAPSDTDDPQATPETNPGDQTTAEPGGNVPANTENSGEPGERSGLGKIKPILFIVGGVLVAALIAVVVLVVVRSSKEKKNSR